MNAIVKGKVFKSGNSAAVRLPKELGFEPGTEIVLERRGNAVTIRAADDKEAIRREVRRMADDIRAIWAEHGGPPVPEQRDQDIFPERPGLY